jgi:hypothetical protein
MIGNVIQQNGEAVLATVTKIAQSQLRGKVNI